MRISTNQEITYTYNIEELSELQINIIINCIGNTKIKEYERKYGVLPDDDLNRLWHDLRKMKGRF